MFWRDRKELITILVLPILLIVVLNFAFSGIFGSEDDSTMDLHVAIVNMDDESAAMRLLKDKLVQDASLGAAEAEQIVERASIFRPVSMLLEYLRSQDVQQWLTVHPLSEAEAVLKVEEGEIDGILLIPEGFTAESLYAAFVGEAPATTFIFKIDKETNNNFTLQQIIAGFTDHLNYQFAIQEIGGSSALEVISPEGGIETVGSGASFTLAQYFTVTMGALFALFIAATVATKSGEEIRLQVFQRILLSNSHPLSYLMGKIVSTFCLVWLQIMFVLVLAHFILQVFPDRSITFWLGVVGMISLLALAVAGLTALLTSISLRVKNIDTANGIFMLVIIVFGVIGGNFVPKFVLPEWLQSIGEWTPNGTFLVMFTEWIQFEELSVSVFIPSMLLIVFFLITTFIGLYLYPKRGEA